MNKKLYAVTLRGGRSHNQFFDFKNNVEELKAKAPDFGGLSNVCLISSGADEVTLHMLCSEGLKDTGDVTVEEITKHTLADEEGHHQLYSDLINNYFLPYGKYSNI